MMAAVLSGKKESIPLKVQRADGQSDDISITAEQLPGGQFRRIRNTKTMTLKLAKLPPQDANLLFTTTG